MSTVTGPLLGVFDTEQARLIGITQNGGSTDITYLAGQDTPTPSGLTPITGDGGVTKVLKKTQAQYDAIVTKDTAALYVIVG